MDMLETHQSMSPLASVRPVLGITELASLIRTVQQVYLSAPVKEYAVAIGRATREHQHVRLGASPRALLQLVRAAKAEAALNGRDFVLPDDIRTVSDAVLAHRLLLDRRALSSGETASSVVESILSRTPVNSARAG